MDLTGQLEIHLTISLDNPEDIERLKSWGEYHGLKCLHILLDRGDNRSQPMLTKRFEGKLSEAIVEAARFEALLKAEGFQVVRTKIEASPQAGDIPRETTGNQPHQYFENHIRIVIDENADLAVLAKTAEAHSAHLSRNTFRRNEDGHDERFVTQRCRNCSYAESRSQLDSLLSDIRGLNLEIVDIEEELVVYDSNLDLDSGWIRAIEEE